MFPSSKITEEQEKLLMEFFFTGFQTRRRKRSQPGAEPEIRRSRRKPNNQLERAFLERGLNA